MQLSEEQQIVFNKYLSKKNIFMSGPGGSGKTELIRQIYSHANKHDTRICVTAMTGCAAMLLECNASTIHSWAGIGIANKSIKHYFEYIKKSKINLYSWLKTEVLIIDEVSMLSYHLFDVINKLGQLIRKNEKPFGGIQVIFSGDFYQLPPVEDYNSLNSKLFCFQHPSWFDCFEIDNHVILKTVFRQTDNDYKKILLEIRKGTITKKSVELLKTRIVEPPDFKPTKLLPKRNLVDNINKTKLHELPGEIKTYKLERCTYDSMWELCFNDYEIESEYKFLENNSRCEHVLNLKIGAQVMCIVNIRDNATKQLLVCNGSIGTVVSFSLTGFPCVKFNNGNSLTLDSFVWGSDKIKTMYVKQVPLVLAWAMTIHKSQGATMDAAEINAGKDIFECGQIYVALSRIKTLDGLYMSHFDPFKIKINPIVSKFYESLNLELEQDKRNNMISEFKIDVTCSKCMKSITEIKNTFIKLENCRHILCKNCIVKISEEFEDKCNVSCPFCRKTFNYNLVS